MAKRTQYKKICEQCGAEYTTENKHQKYCSYKCRGEAQKKGQTYICENCGKEFFVHDWDSRWRKNDPKYCSTDCYHLASRNAPRRVEEETRTCEQCGKPFTTKVNSGKRFCSIQCVYNNKREAERRPTKGKDGYMYVWFSDGSGMKEHRYIMEQNIGRKLEQNECVHHIDGNRTNNDLSNLQLMTIGEHSKLHREKEIAEGKLLFGREAQEHD